MLEEGAPWRRRPQSAILRGGHDAGDFAEDFADAASHTRHDCTGGYGDKSGHEGVLDQILTRGVAPDPQPIKGLAYGVVHRC